MPTRRRLITALALGAATAAVTIGASASGATAPALQRMRVLVLGGTRFIGRHMVEHALARGHQVTLFNRGVSNPGLFPDVEKLQGDRNDDLKSLEGRQWDVVLDTSGFVPRQVRMSAQLLARNVAHYLYVSSISVYRNWQTANDEDSPLAPMPNTAPTDVVTGETYGPLKALCEREIQAAFPGRSIIVRPGYVVGPDDTTDRFTYWPVRVSRGGEVLSPGRPGDPLQFIDVRDLARWCVACVEQRTAGVFNAVHAPGFTTIGAVLRESQRQSRSRAQLTWVDAAFLASVVADLPLWAPPTGETAALMRTSNTRAVRAGLATTPLRDTIRATLEWWHARPPQEQRLHAGIDATREAELLQAWHSRSSRK